MKSDTNSIYKNMNVLFVDDEKSILKSIQRELSDEVYNKHFASNGHDAIKIMDKIKISVLITDLKMPEISGLELLKIVQEKFPDIIRIILTGHAEISTLISAINSGQVFRYLKKPWKLDEEFIPAIKHAIDYYLILKEREKLLKELKNKNIELNNQNKILKELSSKDGLTGIYNHRYFQEEINRQFAVANRNKTDLCLLIIDIDHFKQINDNYGHAFGDHILKKLTKVISTFIRSSDFFARYGGEEFAVLLPSTNASGGSILAENIRAKFENYEFSDNKNTAKITVSIGIASKHNSKPKSSSEIFEYADKALYVAKNMGRNQISIYT